jgi:hypothetical protein
LREQLEGAYDGQGYKQTKKAKKWLLN